MSQITQEEFQSFRAIPGFEHYFISDEGVLVSDWTGRPKVMKTFLKRGTYPEVKLRKNCGYIHKTIHQAVLEAFVGPKPEKMEARHLDGNPLNNRLDNLAWGTRIENNNDQIRHGTAYVAQGELHGKAVLTEKDVLDIRASEAAGSALARKYGVSHTQIIRVRTGFAWSHIPDPALR